MMSCVMFAHIIKQPDIAVIVPLINIARKRKVLYR